MNLFLFIRDPLDLDDEGVPLGIAPKIKQHLPHNLHRGINGDRSLNHPPKNIQLNYDINSDILLTQLPNMSMPEVFIKQSQALQTQIAMNREELVLIVCKSNISTATLEPLQLIIPTLQMSAPLTIYTSTGRRITASIRTELYSALAEALLVEGESSLSETLRIILYERKDNTFRVCILGGEQVSWDIVLEYKRRNILIDTAGEQQLLSQVSHTTGGVSKSVNPQNIIKNFLTSFSMSTEIRKYFVLQKDSTVTFHLQPWCCRDNPLKTTFYSCSVCMHIYCPKHAQETLRCSKCQHEFDQPLPHLHPDMEVPLINKEMMGSKKPKHDKVEVN